MIVSLLSVVPLAAWGEETDETPARDVARDVVLVTVDTLRRDALGFLADGTWATPVPALSRFAAGARRFPHAYAHHTVTLPSHANLLTGLYPQGHGVRDNAGYELGAGHPTAATLFAGAGFATGAVVSAFVLDARFGLDRGFESYDDRVERHHGQEIFRVGERPGHEAVESALAWWRENADRRRFLWLHLFDPHAPYAPPEPFASRFSDAPYRGEVAAVDHFLSKLLAELDADLDADTEEPDPFTPRPFVLLTADHGEALGDHGEATHGVFAYESTLRVPFLFRGPGVELGEDARLARHVDVLPTLLEAAGLDVPPDLAGRSLLGPAEEDQEVATSYFECLTPTFDRGWAPLRGVVAETEEGGREKLIDLPLPELYDLVDDPGEEHNLAAERPERVAELRALLPEESPWPPRRGDVESDEVARLRALGYLADEAPASESRGSESWGPEDDPKRLIHLDRAIHRASRLFADGGFAEAEAVARGLVEERPGMPVGHEILAQALLSRGETAAAVEVIEAAHERGVAGDTLVRQWALALARLGRAEEAVRLLRPRVRDAAEDADPALLSVYGKVLREAGRPEDARDALRRALDAWPEDAASWERLSAVHLDLGRPAEAREAARRAVDLDPARPHAWNHLGVALYLVGERRAALDAWVRSLELDPDQWDTLYNVGLKGAELGRPDLARRALRDFLERAPADRYGRDFATARRLLRRLEE